MWALAGLMCEAAFVFAITALVVGVVFLALCPLILWAPSC